MNRRGHRTPHGTHPPSGGRWVAVAIIVVGVAVLARTQRYYGTLLRGWDAQHYYAHAHSLVFDRDADITNNLQLTPFTAPFDRDADGYLEAVSRDANGKITSPYPVGLSLIEAPFLALGHGARGGLAALGLPSSRPPGYSDVEIWAVALGLLAIFAIGVQLLDEILRPYVPSPGREAALAAAWWGTSLLYYSAVFPFMAHAVGFTLVVWTVSIGQSIFAGTRSPRSLWLLGFALACLYLVRPQQVTIALPLVLLLWPMVKRPVGQWAGWASAAIGTLAIAIAFQAWIHSQLGGAWAVNAYAPHGGRFDWLHPALGTVLLSPARGLLWCSPIVLVAAIGFATTAARDVPRSFAVFALQGLIQLYVIACWSRPEQGDSFGVRMWSEGAGAVACGVGLLSLRRSAAARLLVWTAVGVCLLWTNRLLVLYVSGRLRMGISYAECLRLVLGVSWRNA